MKRRVLRGVLLATATTMLSGCLQLDVHVKLNDDGSATITEKLSFSRRLLDQEVGADKKELRSLLDKETALKRMQHMGRGTTLVSHDLQEAPQGGLQAVAVYKIPDINDFRFVPPHLALPAHPQRYFRISVEPCYSQRWASPDKPGMMAAHFSVTDAPRQKEAAPAKPLTPLELQQLRELQPLFRDLIKGFRVKFCFEAYNPLHCGSPQYPGIVVDRETKIHSPCWWFIDFSDQNLDSLGNNILDNEEILLEILRGDFAGPNIMAQVGCRDYSFAHLHDSKVPLFYPDGMSWLVCRRTFEPSKFHFKKYFDGKPVSQGGNVKE